MGGLYVCVYDGDGRGINTISPTTILVRRNIDRPLRPFPIDHHHQPYLLILSF